MAREPEIDGQHRQIVGVRQLDERPRETKLHDIAVQRNALDPAEQVGQVRRGRADGCRDLAQPQRRGNVFLHEFLGAPNQSAAR